MAQSVLIGSILYRDRAIRSTIATNQPYDLPRQLFELIVLSGVQAGPSGHQCSLHRRCHEASDPDKE